MKLVGIGHSHIICIQRAAEVGQRALDGAGVKVETVWMGEQRFAPYREETPSGGVDGYRLVGALLDEISAKVDGADLIFSCVGGRAHNAFGLVNHPRSFDFVLEEEPDLPLCTDCEVVPAQIVAAALARQGNFESSKWWLKAVSDVIGRFDLHCESPPPAKSEQHLRDHPGSFREMIAKYDVAPALLRYKLWRLHSRLFKALCESTGVQFLAIPSEARDEAGYLVERAWNPDPTHANQWYGQRVIEQLVRSKDPTFRFLEAA